MYRTLVTDKQNKIILVCNQGMGIRKFKILAQSENAIDVEFELAEKKNNIQIIKEWEGDGEFREIEQTYYMVDLESGKLIRISKIGFGTEVPINVKRPMILFSIYTDVEPVIKKEQTKYKVKSSEGVNLTHYWLDERNMPGSIYVIDFDKNEVQKIPQVIFIN